LTDSKTQYGLIPHDNWYQPDWIDEKKATEARNDMVKNQVIYGGMLLVSSKQVISLRFVHTQVAYRTFDFTCFGFTNPEGWQVPEHVSFQFRRKSQFTFSCRTVCLKQSM
jgi:hypothetical protein